MEKWPDFYRPFSPAEDDVQRFVQTCEQLAPPDNVAKIMMHQGQRLVSLSDDMPKIRPRREALRLLFLMMCAENISKLHEGFQGEGQSRAHVRRFFDNLLSKNDKDALGVGFVDHSKPLMPFLGVRAVVDMLYNVRCDECMKGTIGSLVFTTGVARC